MSEAAQVAQEQIGTRFAERVRDGLRGDAEFGGDRLLRGEAAVKEYNLGLARRQCIQREAEQGERGAQGEVGGGGESDEAEALGLVLEALDGVLRGVKGGAIGEAGVLAAGVDVERAPCEGDADELRAGGEHEVGGELEGLGRTGEDRGEGIDALGDGERGLEICAVTAIDEGEDAGEAAAEGGARGEAGGIDDIGDEDDAGLHGKSIGLVFD